MADDSRDQCLDGDNITNSDSCQSFLLTENKLNNSSSNDNNFDSTLSNKSSKHPCHLIISLDDGDHISDDSNIATQLSNGLPCTHTLTTSPTHSPTTSPTESTTTHYPPSCLRNTAQSCPDLPSRLSQLY